ncbi:hypothetical protein D3C76_1498110 [compost metagenome]
MLSFFYVLGGAVGAGAGISSSADRGYLPKYGRCVGTGKLVISAAICNRFTLDLLGPAEGMAAEFGLA